MLTINHVNGKNCNISKEYPKVYYMKKWWLEHKFLNEEGKVIEFKGWINTIALSKEDFPEVLQGTFWASKVPENGYYKGNIGMKGRFDIGFGEENNYIIGSCYPSYLLDDIDFQNNPTREKAELILKSNKPLPRFPYFQAKIEDCLIPEKSYITAITNN